VALGAASQSSAVTTFRASADAAAVRTSFVDPKAVPFLTGGGTDVTTPRAQASGNSLGTSQGFASALYPGDDLAGIADLVGLFLPADVPLSLPSVKFPLTVRADTSTPSPAAQTSGAYQLTAMITAGGGAQSTASAGVIPGLSPALTTTSAASVTPTPDHGVRAEGTTTTTGLSLPGLLSLGTVSTRATASRSASGDLTRSADMTITGASVLGLPLELKNGSLVLPVLGQELSVQQAIASIPVLGPLAAQGVSITFQKAVNTPNGVTAPGIEVTWVRDVPAIPLPVVPLPPLVPAQPNIGPIPPSEATFRFAVGFASASATLSSFDDTVAPPPAGGPATPPSNGGPQPVSRPTGSGNGSNPVLPSVGRPSDTGAPGPNGAQDPEIAPPPGDPGVPAGSVTATPVAYDYGGLDLGNIYLALVVSGLLAVGAGHLVRHLGVRTVNG
jgi:hypothetical protein